MTEFGTCIKCLKMPRQNDGTYTHTHTYIYKDTTGSDDMSARSRLENSIDRE